MKKLSYFLLIIFATVVVINISQAKDIGPEEAFELIKEDNSVVVIDVRTPEEFVAGHLDNAININFNNSGFGEIVDKFSKNGTYLLYCRSGVRSIAAEKIMKDLNFKNTYNMTGGFLEWSSKGLPVIN